jgi:uncharacterized protein (TIGR00730 family)
MSNGYEINELAKEESWRMFLIIGEMVEGFEKLSGVEPAISFYGSARTGPEEDIYLETVEIAKRLAKLGFSIITGGGPGIMEAANKGAFEVGANSIGLNIDLPEEQAINPYTTLSITFRHFFVRKVMLVKYATAFIIMPGGLGTLDELTEVLTLMQTHKIHPFPVILYDSQYWKGFLDWLHNSALVQKMISEEDFDLLRICDTPDMAIDVIQKWYKQQRVIGLKALSENAKR